MGHFRRGPGAEAIEPGKAATGGPAATISAAAIAAAAIAAALAIAARIEGKQQQLPLSARGRVRGALCVYDRAQRDA
jgi:hypothetical protein